VLEAVRPGYFGHSENGAVTVQARGVTKFTAGSGNREYLRLDPARRAEILTALKILSSEPPARR
jgi:hypothetical protein